MRIDANNQYGRRDISQLHNKKVKPGENTKDVVVDFFCNEMGLSIYHSDISTCHRMNTPQGSEWNGGSPEYDPSSPPIYIKFISRDVRNYVMRNKFRLRHLKNSEGYKYFLHENLTPFRRSLFRYVKDTLSDFRYVWTKEGTIMVRRYSNSRAYKIYSYSDVDRILGE